MQQLTTEELIIVIRSIRLLAGLSNTEKQALDQVLAMLERRSS